MNRQGSFFNPRLFLLAFWIVIIVWLSLIPKPPKTDISFFGFDKLLHAAAYCALTLLAGWSISASISLSRRSWLVIALSAALFGGLMEIAQAAFTVTRQAEFGDLLANTFGASVALFVAEGARALIKARKKRGGSHSEITP